MIKYLELKNQHKYILSGLLFLILVVTTNQVKISENLGPNDPDPYEIGTMDYFNEPLEVVTAPFTAVLGDYTYPIFWGIIIVFLWLRVENTMIVGIVGFMLSLFITFSTAAQTVGVILLGLSIGITFYQLLSTKLHYNMN